MLHGGGPGYFATLQSVLPHAFHPNLLVLWYEDMKQDERKMVESIADHIGCKLDKAEVERLTNFMTFENYKNVCSLDKPQVVGEVGGQFLRKGVVGDWVHYFTYQMNKNWDPWIYGEMRKLGLEERIVSY